MDTVKTDILSQTADHVTALFKKMPDKLLYHDLSHTEEVVEIAKILGKASDLSEKQLEILIIAAWFHDTGYIEKYEGHEEMSQQHARDFLYANDYPEEDMNEVIRLIGQTDDTVDKNDLLSRILHDADMAHLGRKRFFRKGELLRIEFENVYDKKYTQLEWEQSQYDFLVGHKFLTEAAHDEFHKRKVKNIKKQRQNVLKAHKVTTRIKTGKDLGRGVDTLYRSNYRNHINLSSIADGKANMMISINTIMISVIVTLSGASFSMSKSEIVEHLRFTVPILILLVGSLASVIFAVLSARPKVTSKNVDSKKVFEDKLSLLYFGNFLKIPKQKFIDHMNELKQDQHILYDSMSKDLYNLGGVLQKKYSLLTISYNIFITSLSLTVIAFLVIFIYTNS